MIDHIFAQPVLGLEIHRGPLHARLCSRRRPLETASTSVAMRGASSSTIKSDVSLAALMQALSVRAAFLDRLATQRATAGFNRLPVFVDLLTSLACDTALTISLENDATKVSGGSLNASLSARSIKRPVGRNVSPSNLQINSECASKKHSIDLEITEHRNCHVSAARKITNSGVILHTVCQRDENSREMTLWRISR